MYKTLFDPICFVELSKGPFSFLKSDRILFSSWFLDGMHMAREQNLTCDFYDHAYSCKLSFFNLN